MSEMEKLLDRAKIRFCYTCFGKNDRTCYLPKGHKGKHAGMKAAVRQAMEGK